MPEPSPPSQSEEAWDAAIGASFAAFADVRGGDETARTDLPQSIGKYGILREVGRGGMGVVYLAEHTTLHRLVALKVLTAHDRAAEALERFRREAESIATLDHPGIVRVHDNGSDGAHHFIEMELVEGAPLDRVMAELRERHPDTGAPVDGAAFGAAVAACTCRGADPTATPEVAWDPSYVKLVCRLMAAVAGALQHAHDNQVVHRDVKPSNILVRPDGSPVLTDFGLAFELQRPGITQTGVLACTPHYASPEQARGDKARLDHRTDIFSLGITMYELLTLRRPFEGATSEEVLARIQRAEPVNPRRLYRRLPRDLATIVLKALEKEPERRYATAAALADDLRAFLAYQPIAARPTSVATRVLRFARRRRSPLLAAAVAAVAVSGSLGYLAQPMTVEVHCIYDNGAPVGADFEAGSHERQSPSITLSVDDRETIPIDNPAVIEIPPGPHSLRVITGLGASGAATVDGWPLSRHRVILTIVRSEELLAQLDEMLRRGDTGRPEVRELLGRLRARDRDTARRRIEAARDAHAEVGATAGAVDELLATELPETPEFVASRRRALTRIERLRGAPYDALPRARQTAERLLADLLGQLKARALGERRIDAVEQLLAFLQEFARVDARGAAAVDQVTHHLASIDETRRLQLIHDVVIGSGLGLAESEARFRVMAAINPEHPLTVAARQSITRRRAALQAMLARGVAGFAADDRGAVDAVVREMTAARSSHLPSIRAGAAWLDELARARETVATDWQAAQAFGREPGIDRLDTALQDGARKHVESLFSAVMKEVARRVDEQVEKIDGAAAAGDVARGRAAREALQPLAVLGQERRVADALGVIDDLEREARDLADARERLHVYLRDLRGTAPADAAARLGELRRLWQRLLADTGRRLAKHPQNDARRLLRARLNLRLGRPAAVLDDAGRLAVTAEGAMLCGQAAYLRGDVAKAEGWFETARRGAEGRARYWLAACRHDRADRGHTLDDLRRAAASAGNCADVHYLAALLHVHDKAYEDAVTAARAALESAPITEDMMIRVCRVSPPDVHWFDVFRSDALATRAQAHLMRQEFDLCVEDCERALRHHGKSGAAWLFKGAARSAQDRPDDAVECLERAIPLLEDPESRKFAGELLDSERKKVEGRARKRR